MAVIPDPEMGDVWPAVEPGSDTEDYGSAELHPTEPAEVRSYRPVTVTYTVGKFGLDDTGGIIVSFRWVNDCGPFQIDDPSAANLVTATASNGAPLTVFIEPYGYRPWTLAVRITVTGGFMREGDTIDVVFGDTSAGGPGMRMQTIAEEAFELRVSVDACATGQFNPLPEKLHFPVLAGPPETWKIVSPARRRVGEPFRVGIKAEDAWGNPARPGPRALNLSVEGPVGEVPETVSFGPGDLAVDVPGVVGSAPGTAVLTLWDYDTELARSIPIVLADEGPSGYWGDLHGQSGETVGIGTIEEYLGFARDIAFLDVTGHQGNDFQITNAFWDKINAVTSEMDEDGRFVVYPGYEWSGNTPVGGDHNVFFRHEWRQIRRSSHAMLADRSDIATDATTLNVLFDSLRDEDCVLWSHVGGRPADVSYAHDPALKTAVEVHSNWGTFEWILTDSLALGHRVGVVSNSDGHKGRPGAGPPGATEFGAYGGLTCFLASALSRDAIFEAMRRRHHYGTSGSRLDLDVRARFAEPADLYPRDPRHCAVTPEKADEAIMGDIAVSQGPTIELDVSVTAGSAIQRIDVLDGAETVHTWRPYGAGDLGNRVRVTWQGAEYRGRGRNTLWKGEVTVAGAQIRGMTPVNQWNPERPLYQADPHRVVFEAVTSGNFAGVDLDLDGPARLDVTTNLVNGQVDIASLGVEDTLMDAGGLERQIRVTRLPDRLASQQAAITVDLPVPEDRDAAYWVRVTTEDGHLAWSSPIYLSRTV